MGDTLSNSLLKSLHKYNFSKYPIESVRNRIVNNYSAKSVMSYKTSEPVQSDLITLSARDGKVFGNISKDAYSAISKGTLESYVPKNDNERFVLDEYRKYPTIPLSSSEEDELGTVSYNTYKSLSKGENVSSFYNENEKERHTAACRSFLVAGAGFEPTTFGL